MNRVALYSSIILIVVQSTISQVLPKVETNLAGVHQGKTLFIQNPFNKDERRFCIESIYINEKYVDLNYKMSAIKLDFEGYDLYSPVKIRIEHRDTLCIPTIINPEAILFHTIFRFTSVSLSDSALLWSTKGETGKGHFEIEKLNNGVWIDQEIREDLGGMKGQTIPSTQTWRREQTSIV